MTKKRVAYRIAWAILIIGFVVAVTDTFGLTGKLVLEITRSVALILGTVLAVIVTDEEPA